jgi:hypothetical protein
VWKCPHTRTSRGIEVIRVPQGRVDEFLLNLPDGVELDLRVPGILWVLKQKGLL